MIKPTANCINTANNLYHIRTLSILSTQICRHVHAWIRLRGICDMTTPFMNLSFSSTVSFFSAYFSQIFWFWNASSLTAPEMIRCIPDHFLKTALIRKSTPHTASLTVSFLGSPHVEASMWQRTWMLYAAPSARRASSDVSLHSTIRHTIYFN